MWSSSFRDRRWPCVVTCEQWSVHTMASRPMTWSELVSYKIPITLPPFPLSPYLLLPVWVALLLGCCSSGCGGPGIPELSCGVARGSRFLTVPLSGQLGVCVLVGQGHRGRQSGVAGTDSSWGPVCECVCVCTCVVVCVCVCVGVCCSVCVCVVCALHVCPNVAGYECCLSLRLSLALWIIILAWLFGMFVW